MSRILMVRLWQHLLIGTRWAQIAGRLCGIVAGGGDILIVATRVGGAASERDNKLRSLNQISHRCTYV